MAASYPTSTPSFTTKATNDVIAASHVNALQDEIVAIAGALRTSLQHNLLFTDATYDIGASGATRPQDLFLSRNATIGGTLGVTGVATLTAGFKTTSGKCYIGDDANAQMTLGLTINQGGADDEILALKSSDVAHGITDFGETDTYGAVRKDSATNGGLQLTGFSATGAALVVRGMAGAAADTTHTAAGIGVINIRSYVKSGTSVAAVGADGNLFTVGNQSSAKFIVDAEGDTFQDGSAGTAYSDYDDPMLALAVEHHINPKQRVAEVFQQYCQYNKDTLIEAGILAPDDEHGNRGFVNMSALTRLTIGGIWQLGLQVKQLRGELVQKGLLT